MKLILSYTLILLMLLAPSLQAADLCVENLAGNNERLESVNSDCHSELIKTQLEEKQIEKQVAVKQVEVKQSCEISCALTTGMGFSESSLLVSQVLNFHIAELMKSAVISPHKQGLYRPPALHA
jgi:hypothetical protein